MKILLLSTFQAGAYGQVILKNLREMGYSTLGIDHRAMGQIMTQRQVDKHIALLCKTYEPDIIFAIKGRGISPSVLADQPAFKVNWWLDNVTRFSDFKEYTDVYDKYYAIEASQGHPWMAIGIDPDIHRPLAPAPEEGAFFSEVVFAGTGHIRRNPRIIKILSPLPYDIAIWGNAWPQNTPFHRGPAIYFDGLMKIHTGADLILNNHYVPGITPNMRAIEAPASGTAMISDGGEGIEKCLRRDKEFICYDSIKEARYLIRKYIEEPEARRKIGKAGYRKVYKKHLLKDKLVEMLCLKKSS
jgi:spore maturation protein CgeB